MERAKSSLIRTVLRFNELASPLTPRDRKLILPVLIGVNLLAVGVFTILAIYRRQQSKNK